MLFNQSMRKFHVLLLIWFDNLLGNWTLQREHRRLLVWWRGEYRSYLNLPRSQRSSWSFHTSLRFLSGFWWTAVRKITSRFTVLMRRWYKSRKITLLVHYHNFTSEIPSTVHVDDWFQLNHRNWHCNSFRLRAWFNSVNHLSSLLALTLQ